MLPQSDSTFRRACAPYDSVLDLLLKKVQPNFDVPYSTSRMARPLSSSVSYHPTKKRSHSTHIIGDFMYLWGGCSDEELDLRKMDIFNLRKGTWEHKKTRGTPPRGARGYCSAVIGNKIYYFGGYSESDDTFHNSLSCYDTLENKWEELFPSQDQKHSVQCPIRKEDSKMVVYTTDDGKKYLVVIGGYGPKVADDTLQGVKTASKGLFTSHIRIDEQHYFKLTEGVWVKPAIAGTRPPPCDSFTLTQLDDKRALLFGGSEETMTMSNSVYIANFSSTKITWENLPKPGTSDFPDRRYGHSAALLRSCHHENHIIIVGGYYLSLSTPCNIWLYNVDTKSWSQLTLSDHSVVNKYYQSMSVWEVILDRMWLILYGGRQLVGCDYSHDMTIIELISNSETWMVGDVLHAPFDSNYEEVLTKRQDDFIRYIQKGNVSLGHELQKVQSQERYKTGASDLESQTRSSKTDKETIETEEDDQLAIMKQQFEKKELLLSLEVTSLKQENLQLSQQIQRMMNANQQSTVPPTQSNAIAGGYYQFDSSVSNPAEYTPPQFTRGETTRVPYYDEVERQQISQEHDALDEMRIQPTLIANSPHDVTDSCATTVSITVEGNENTDMDHKKGTSLCSQTLSNDNTPG